jgi:hypothetical protein
VTKSLVEEVKNTRNKDVIEVGMDGIVPNMEEQGFEIQQVAVRRLELQGVSATVDPHQNNTVVVQEEQSVTQEEHNGNATEAVSDIASRGESRYVENNARRRKRSIVKRVSSALRRSRVDPPRCHTLPVTKSLVEAIVTKSLVEEVDNARDKADIEVGMDGIFPNMAEQGFEIQQVSVRRLEL